MVNDSTRLLGLDGLPVVTVENGTDGQTPVVHLATGDEQAPRCPQCATGQAGQAMGDHRTAGPAGGRA